MLSDSVTIVSLASKQSVDDVNTDSLSKCFRFLRDGCRDENFQTEVGEHPTLVRDSLTILHSLVPRISDSSEAHASCLRLGVQFLGNLSVKHEKNQHLLWANFTVLRSLFETSDRKARNYASMVLNNVIVGRPDKTAELVSNVPLLKIIIDDAIEDSDFSLYLVENVIREGGLEGMYEGVGGSRERGFLLELGQSLLSGAAPADTHPLPPATLRFLADLFKRQSDRILKTVSDYVHTVDPPLFVRLTSLLGAASSRPGPLHEDKSFFINCCYLLVAIHRAGKEEGENVFTPLGKLSMPSEELSRHPAFGLKAELVRCLGNLCSANRDCQNLVRELDCIPLILECCNIDARNPLIMQWAIVCIKHLCEGNPENKAVVASLRLEGGGQNPLLDEMGFTLHTDPTGKNPITLVPCSKRS